MGSFDYTCAVSGLPIGAGTKVRFLLLQSSPFDARGNYADGELCWYLRSLPIRAAYNDYGSVEDLDPRDAGIRQNWLDGVAVDLVEKGWGDNTCHDVPARRGMSFDDLLAALQEDRLRVRPDLETAEDRKRFRDDLRTLAPRRKTARGIPTMRRVEAAIRRSGSFTYTVDAEHIVRGPGGPYRYTPPVEAKNYYAPADPHAGFGGERVDGAEVETWRLDATGLGNEAHKLIVDRLRRGEIRVRVGAYAAPIEEGLRLSHLARRLRRRYSVMLSPGQHGYAELIVRPKPGTLDGDHLFDFHTRVGRPGKPRACHLASAMVREDVWQALCGMTSEYWSEHGTVRATLDVYRKLAREAWDAYRAEFLPRSDDPLRASLRGYRWKGWGHDMHNPVGHFTGDNPSIGGFGMNVSWMLFADKDGHADAEVENFLDVLAQTTLVESVLSMIRIRWRPVGSYGPQFGEWKDHRSFLRKVLRIATSKVRQDEIEQAEDRGWERRWQQEQKEKGRS